MTMAHRLSTLIAIHINEKVRWALQCSNLCTQSQCRNTTSLFSHMGVGSLSRHQPNSLFGRMRMTVSRYILDIFRNIYIYVMLWSAMENRNRSFSVGKFIIWQNKVFCFLCIFGWCNSNAINIVPIWWYFFLFYICAAHLATWNKEHDWRPVPHCRNYRNQQYTINNNTR